jgi:cell division protein ZipA
MGFSQTLIWILVIAILLVAADAVRRIINDRRGQLRMKIDPRFHDLPEDDRNPELPGKARPAARLEPQQMSLDDMPPPLVMEADDEADSVPLSQPVSTVRPIAQTAAERQTGKTAATHRPVVDSTAKPESEKPGKESAILDVIVVHLLFPQGVDGERLLQSLLQQGLRYGEMKIFHLHQQGDLLYSLANAREPGYFNIDTLEQERFKAISFFTKLPGPREPLVALNRMLASAQYLARELEGELRDENRIVLTQQMMEHLRERVQEFERRQRVPNGQ